MMLDDIQNKACCDIMSKDFLVACMVGGPGTGKTATINAIVERLQKKGVHVLVLAPTGRAAANTKIGMTIARFFKSREFIEKAKQAHGEPWAQEAIKNLSGPSAWAIDISPGSQGIVIIDEGFMVTLATWQRVTNAFSGCTTKNGIKFVIVGDYNQLPPVGGEAFYTDTRFMKWGRKGQLRFFQLEKSYRCGGDPALETLLNGFKAKGNKSNAEGVIDDIFHKSKQVKLKRPHLIITQRNKSVNEYNRAKSDNAAIGRRFVLLHLGSHPDEPAFKYSEGERVVITQNEYGLVPNEENDDEIENGPSYRQDLVKINGQFGTITNLVATVDDNGTPLPVEGDLQVFDVKLDIGRTVTIHTYKKGGKYFADVGHGYASTLYKVQGLGFDIGSRIAVDTKRMSPREVMTAFSRVKSTDDLFFDHEKPDASIHAKIVPIDMDPNLKLFIDLMSGTHKYTNQKRSNRKRAEGISLAESRSKRQARAIEATVFEAGNLKL